MQAKEQRTERRERVRADAAATIGAAAARRAPGAERRESRADRGEGPSERDERPRRAPLGLAILGALAGALALVATACSSAEPPRSALLVTIDTTRADALGAHGRDLGQSPHLDRLAREGILFEAAHTTIPLTLPAHSSMMTGLIPPRHGVRNNGWPLPESARTLAELASAAGVQTGAFVAAVVLDSHLGIAQGFETYSAPRERSESSSSHYTERPAKEVVDEAIGWLLDRDPKRPFFLWVHVFEPHDPLEPPPDLLSGALANEPYLAEVASADRELGRLFDMLRAEGLLDETLVLATSDHGEAFGEHGERSHGLFCYEPTMHVPLIVRLPGGARAGERRPEPVSVVDVLPTIAGALGLEVPPRLDGRDLVAEPLDVARGVYLESYWAYLNYGWSPLSGWLDADAKYLHSSEPELYARPDDPGEERDLFARRADDAARYRAELERAASGPALRAEASALDPELAERIRSLGYAGIEDAGGELPAPLETHGLRSPRRGAKEHEALLAGQALMNRGDVRRAETVLREVLAHNPANYAALDYLAYCLMRQDRQAEAIEPLERLIHARPERTNAYYNLALCLWAAERRGDAIDTLRVALERNPTHPRYLEDFVRFLTAEGRGAEAREYEERLRGLRAR